jgi:hypothetical protein
MSATYDPRLPTARDRVRFMLRDTDMSDAALTDAEIEYYLTIEKNEFLAAAALGGVILAGSQGLSSINIDGISIETAAGAESYKQYLGGLRRRGVEAAMGSGSKIFGVWG